VLEASKHLLVAGLGNPGKKYELTRHNMGFLVIMEWAKMAGWQFKEEKRFKGVVAKGILFEKKIHLLLPLTYMNDSGTAVRLYLEEYGFSANDLLVVCDDIYLEFGKMRIRPTGSAGGHNGLKSIIGALGTQDFPRLRMGIGDTRDTPSLSDYVLSSFTKEEMEALPGFVHQGALALQTFSSQ
jgi:PTH1 family peptidyl-tRNA hydrolase